MRFRLAAIIGVLAILAVGGVCANWIYAEEVVPPVADASKLSIKEASREGGFFY